MKILFVNTLYTPFKVGGAEVSVQTMAEGFALAGNQVYVLTLGYEESVRKMNGVIIISIKTKNLYHIEKAAGQNFLKKMIWHLLDSANIFYRQKLRSILDRVKPDVVNTNNIQGFSPYLWKVVKSKNIKLVHTLRDYYLLCHATSMYTKCGDCQQLCTACNFTYQIKKKYFGLPDGYVGISDFILEQHAKFNVGKGIPARVIANGVSPLIGPPPRVKSPVDEVVLGFMGKVNVQKGVDYLFEELAKIDVQMPFRLVVAGKADPNFQEMLTKKYGDKFMFSFAGKVDPKTFYKEIDLVIVPSGWNEPFGRVPIEAVAAYTPVCLAYKAGLKELYNEQQMWRFDMTENSLSALLTSILKEPSRIAEKSAACATVQNNYSPALLNQQLADFIETIHD
jgi:glycosyltransferase involved in cell wall biosynthesis